MSNADLAFHMADILDSQVRDRDTERKALKLQPTVEVLRWFCRNIAAAAKNHETLSLLEIRRSWEKVDAMWRYFASTGLKTNVYQNQLLRRTPAFDFWPPTDTGSGLIIKLWMITSCSPLPSTEIRLCRQCGYCNQGKREVWTVSNIYTQCIVCTWSSYKLFRDQYVLRTPITHCINSRHVEHIPADPRAAAPPPIVKPRDKANRTNIEI